MLFTQVDAIFTQIAVFIKKSHERIATTIDSEITELYWLVGNTINQGLLEERRAEYGTQAM